MWIRFLEQLRSLKTTAKELMVGVFLYAKSFVCNQHLNLYRPMARRQFLIPTVTRTNTQQQQQQTKSNLKKTTTP
jgi:hypothetical protein